MTPSTRRHAIGAALTGLSARAAASAADQFGAAIIGSAHSHALGHLEAIRKS